MQDIGLAIHCGKRKERAGVYLQYIDDADQESQGADETEVKRLHILYVFSRVVFLHTTNKA